MAGGRLETPGQSATAAFFRVTDVLPGCLKQVLPGLVLTNPSSVLKSPYRDVIKGYLKSGILVHRSHKANPAVRKRGIGDLENFTAIDVAAHVVSVSDNG